MVCVFGWSEYFLSLFPAYGRVEAFRVILSDLSNQTNNTSARKILLRICGFPMHGIESYYIRQKLYTQISSDRPSFAWIWVTYCGTITLRFFKILMDIFLFFSQVSIRCLGPIPLEYLSLCYTILQCPGFYLFLESFFLCKSFAI